MTQALNRREMLHRTAAGLTSFFCVGRLRYDALNALGQEELQLAAATSFELMLQQVFIPYGRAEGPFEIPPEVRAKADEVSKWLTPSSAPPIFREARVVSQAGEIIVQFSDIVSVSLSKRSIDQLRRFLAKHPGARWDTSNVNDHDVVDCIVQSFTFAENWKYD
jgi:hypothetical protein